MSTILFSVTVLGMFITAAMCTPAGEGVFEYNKTVKSQHPYYREYFQMPRSNRISLTYTIRFEAERCCPVLGFDLSPTLGEIFHSDFCYDEILYHFILVNHYLIPIITCTLIKREYVCTGKRVFVAPYPQYWLFLAGYECKKTKALNIKVNVTINYFDNFKSTCKPFNSRNCHGLLKYNHTAFPNALGEVREKEANDFLTIVMGLVQHLECYQHLQVFLCRTFIPECNNGSMRYPCFDMCQEALTGCRTVVDRIDPNLFCTGAIKSRDPNKCFYAYIRCPNVRSPQFGAAHVTGKELFATVGYSCKNGYELKGDVTRSCTYSGKWNGTAPVCEHLSQTHSHVRIILLVLLLLAIIVIVGICVHYRMAIKTFVRRYDTIN